jgi:hypothetical protein
MVPDQVPDPPRPRTHPNSLSAPGLHLPAHEPRVGAQTLEQMLTEVTAHDSNPFGDAPKDDASFDQRPAVDVSQAAMSRLRTPFSLKGDADWKAGDSSDLR